MDLDTIEGGDDFIAVIEAKINLSDVLLAVIGTRWLTVTEANGGRRLDNPGDFVRNEIGKALERGIRVIPVLVGGAVMPRADELPDELRALSERQAVDIRDSHFHADAQQLADAPAPGPARRSLSAWDAESKAIRACTSVGRRGDSRSGRISGFSSSAAGPSTGSATQSSSRNTNWACCQATGSGHSRSAGESAEYCRQVECTGEIRLGEPPDRI